jgi:hypothetical protein
MAGQARTEDDLRREVVEQIAALRASCASYDAGNFWEAKRIASTAYILLQDGGRNIRSLLGQLGWRDKLPYLSTADSTREGPVPHVSLALVRLRASQATFVPLCTDPCEWSFFHDLPFKRWWKEPIFKSSSGKLFSRNNLVTSWRNKDGGGHYDEFIDDDVYINFKNYDGVPLIKTFLEASQDEVTRRFAGLAEIRHAHSAAMRQIAWELEFSMFRAGLINDGPTYRSTLPPNPPAETR